MKTLLKKLLRNKTYNNRGFTLIELLVVIGILGILASALVATIDPFEQLKKANDANLKNVAVEFINANTRYYTTHNALPWNDTNVTGCFGGTNPTAVTLNAAAATGCFSALISDKEIKPGFTSATNLLKDLYVTSSDNGVTVCFNPQSKSGDKDSNAQWDQSGVATTGCVSQTAANTNATTCYWCSQ